MTTLSIVFLIITVIIFVAYIIASAVDDNDKDVMFGCGLFGMFFIFLFGLSIGEDHSDSKQPTYTPKTIMKMSKDSTITVDTIYYLKEVKK